MKSLMGTELKFRKGRNSTTVFVSGIDRRKGITLTVKDKKAYEKSKENGFDYIIDENNSIYCLVRKYHEEGTATGDLSVYHKKFRFVLKAIKNGTMDNKKYEELFYQTQQLGGMGVCAFK